MTSPKQIIPYLIDFSKIGSSEIGYISFAENKDLPFEIKRVYWTYYTPESIVRGRHAHHQLEQILIAASGRIIVQTESRDEEFKTFILDNPNLGLYIPPGFWHTMQYSHSSVQLALASIEYDEMDYIRNYSEFKRI